MCEEDSQVFPDMAGSEASQVTVMVGGEEVDIPEALLEDVSAKISVLTE